MKKESQAFFQFKTQAKFLLLNYHPDHRARLPELSGIRAFTTATAKFRARGARDAPEDQPAGRAGDQVHPEDHQQVERQQPERGGAAGEAALHREPAVHQVKGPRVRGG